VSIEGALLQGSAVAKVVLVEYSDFQCPFCGRFAREIMPKLEEKYIKSGKVQLAFRHLPLPMHPFAQKAAEAVECAARQGAFWGMHNKVFQEPQQLEEVSLKQNARILLLDEKQFSTCLAGQASEKVRRDAAEARKLLVTGTPTFFVGTKQTDGRVKVVQRISGAPPVEQFEAALERVLATK
jgi:protein-disulfide isomerase